MKKYSFLFAVTISFLFASCTKKKPEFGGIKINLTGSSAAYKQVLIDIKDVQIRNEPKKGKPDWISLPTNGGIYNLLALQNGIDTTLVNTTQLEEGKVTAMRLVLGNNSFAVDSTGVTHKLNLPGGSQATITLNGTIVIKPSTTRQVLISFDASKSILVRGANDYQLHPVIKAVD